MKTIPVAAAVLIMILVVLFPIVDLAAAVLYSGTGMAEVAGIRYLRDFITIALAAMTILFSPPEQRIFRAALVYGVFIAIYSVVGVAHGIGAGLVFSSAAILMLPILGVFAGVQAGKVFRVIPAALALLAIMMSISIVFGIYEVNDTEFWSQSIGYGSYLREVKGITNGFNSEADLPWNFFGNEGARRAAGLLAAPLAQGSFVMTVGLCCFAWLLPTSTLLAVVVLSFASVGVYMSGTRGAMLVMLVSLVAYVAMMGNQWKRYMPGFLAGMILFLVFAKDRIIEIVTYTVQMSDGSTEGHLYALLLNLADFHRIIVVGDGVGIAGAMASYMGDKFAGGGEGAFFSIAFQLGLPGALAFLWYYFRLYRQLRIAENVLRLDGHEYASMARMLAAQAIGYVTTFISSEHILTFSGMAAYWILCGLVLGATGARLAKVDLLGRILAIRTARPFVNAASVGV